MIGKQAGYRLLLADNDERTYQQSKMRFERPDIAVIRGAGCVVLAFSALTVIAQEQTAFESPILDFEEVSACHPPIRRSLSTELTEPLAPGCDSCGPGPAIATPGELTAAMNNAYRGVFYANDFSYLRDPAYSGPYFAGDAFKGLFDGKLDLGGEYRSRFHHENNLRGLGLTGNDDQFWLSRVRLFSNYRVTENIRVYGEYLHADSGGEEFASRPIEVNRGEFQNLFVDAMLIDCDDVQVSSRAGRQELLFGAERLVSPLDWANTRRTFDGYRATLTGADNTADLFYTHPVNRIPATGGTNRWDHSDREQSLFGAYLSNQSLGSEWGVSALEGYYIGYDNDGQNFSFHTLGGRVAGDADSFLYEFEGGVQFGYNTDGTRHHAGFMTAGIGKVINPDKASGGWSPTIWAWYDWASGDDSQFVAPGDGSFHHYFPLAHKYNGFMDLFGRRNLHDVNFQFVAPLGERISFLLWYHYFFLDQATTPYSVVMTPYNAANAAVSKDLGHEIDLLLTVTINPRQSLLIGYSHFQSGDYYDTPGVQFSGDADFFYSQYQVRF